MKLATTGPPPYMHRQGWVPRSQAVRIFLKILSSTLFISVDLGKTNINNNSRFFRVVVIESELLNNNSNLNFWLVKFLII